MGCGVSMFDNGVGEDRQCGQLRLIHRKNGSDAIISKPLPVDDDGDGSKGKSKSDEKGRDSHKGESSEDDENVPYSLSFRVYCNSPSDDNTEGDRNIDNMMNKQTRDPESHKGSSTRSAKRTKVGKGLKCILGG